MVQVSDIKEGTTISLDGRLFKVLEVVRHAGSGKMQGFIQLKLRDIRFGHEVDRRFHPSDKLDDVETSKRQMEFLYSDATSHYFMDPQTYEQVGISRELARYDERFLGEGTKVIVEFTGEEPLAVQFPRIVEARVAMTGPGIREGQDNTMKPATLENGVEILVPQFIETGDLVRVDTEKLKYIERVTLKRI